MSAVLSPPPGSRPCIVCGRLPRWAGEANDAEGFDRGWSAAMTYAIRLFWQTECLAIADSFDRSAADCVLKIHTLTTPDNAHAKAIAMWSERAERCRARAAQYREWADGKKSKPLYEVQTRPWLRGDDE